MAYEKFHYGLKGKGDSTTERTARRLGYDMTKLKYCENCGEIGFEIHDCERGTRVRNQPRSPYRFESQRDRDLRDLAFDPDENRRIRMLQADAEECAQTQEDHMKAWLNAQAEEHERNQIEDAVNSTIGDIENPWEVENKSEVASSSRDTQEKPLDKKTSHKKRSKKKHPDQKNSDKEKSTHDH